MELLGESSMLKIDVVRLLHGTRCECTGCRTRERRTPGACVCFNRRGLGGDCNNGRLERFARGL